MALSKEKLEIRRMEQGEFQRYLEDGLAEKIVEVASERIASYGEFMDILFEGGRFVEAYDYFRFENEIVLRNRGHPRIHIS